MRFSAPRAATAWLFQALFACRLTDLLASLPLAFALLCFALGQINVACIFFVVSVWLSVFLEGLSRRHRREGYGTVTFRDIVTAPKSVTRDDLCSTGGPLFHDADRRRVLLRGINLYPPPLETAPYHFARLQACGLTLVRLGITWEAIEPIQPGQYDQAYLTYLRDLVRVGVEHNLSFIISVQQKAWSSACGGTGAPRWTLQKIGFDVDDGTALHSYHHPLASGTMFTLFFGGRDFCPEFCINGSNIQDYLQTHFFRAMVKVAEVLRGEPNVLGFNTFDHASMGMLGCRDLSKFTTHQRRQGDAPTWFQSFQLGAGLAVKVDTYGPACIRLGCRELNTTHKRAWRPGVGCLWKEYGVWGVVGDEVELLQPDYFCWRRLSEGAKVGVDPVRDYFAPFAAEFQRRVQAVDARFWVCVTKPPDVTVGVSAKTAFDRVDKLAWSPPWFDLGMVATKAFRPWICWAQGRERGAWGWPVALGQKNVRREYARQLGGLKQEASTIIEPGPPVLLGEIGCPMDLACDLVEREDRRIDAWDAILGAADAALVSCCLYCYRHREACEGDYAIFGGDCDDTAEEGSVLATGRALPAVIRPYAFRVPGEAQSMRFCVRSRLFSVTFRHDPGVDAPLVVFVPRYQYPEARRVVVEVSDGRYEVDWAQQTLWYWHGGKQAEHTVSVRWVAAGERQRGEDGVLGGVCAAGVWDSPR